MDRKSHAAPVQRDERGYTPRLIQGFGWLLVLGLAATSAALWWAPPLTFSSNVVEGRVLNPATVELPFGPKVSYAVLRVYVFPRGKPVQLWNESLPMAELLLETEKGTVQLALPPWEGWRHHPGVLWFSGPVWKTYETLEGLPVLSEIPGWREATTSRGFNVSYKRLLQGDHVVVEDPETKNARLWRGSLASVQAGHRLATRVAGGMLLVVSMGIGWATVLFTRGRWSLHQ
jgi:hypothetical protein